MKLVASRYFRWGIVMSRPEPFRNEEVDKVADRKTGRQLGRGRCPWSQKKLLTYLRNCQWLPVSRTKVPRRTVLKDKSVGMRDRASKGKKCCCCCSPILQKLQRISDFQEFFRSKGPGIMVSPWTGQKKSRFPFELSWTKSCTMAILRAMMVCQEQA